MSKPQTTIDTKGIAAVLGGDWLQVPVHQRSFEWTNVHVRELLDDVEGVFSRDKDEYYFLGSIVIIAGRDNQRPQVLDGQQRLATVSMILAGIADLFLEYDDVKASNAIRSKYIAEYNIKSKGESHKLKLNTEDEPYYRELLGNKDKEPDVGAPASHFRLQSARNLVYSWLKNHSESAPDRSKWLTGFLEYLQSYAYVIFFIVPDDSDAFLIFETMNDRGLDLSIADLIKNYLLGRAGEHHSNVLSFWVHSIALLRAYGGENIFTTFIRHYWSSKYKIVRERDLYRDMKGRIVTASNVLDFASDLKRNSYYYAAILSPEHEYWNDASVTSRDRLRTLSMLGLEQYRPALLAALAHLNIKEIESLLRLVINWNVRLLIVGGLGSGGMEGYYSEVGQAIRQGDLKNTKEIAKQAQKFIPPDGEFKDRFSTARVSKVYLARYYLQVLERQSSGEAQPELIPNIDPSEVNLEHILPENPGEKWSQFSEEEKRDYLKRLGNLTLLKEKLNKDAKNSSYKTKVNNYYGKSKLHITREILKYKEWNKDSIEKRQRYLAEMAVKAWSLD